MKPNADILAKAITFCLINPKVRRKLISRDKHKDVVIENLRAKVIIIEHRAILIQVYADYLLIEDEDGKKPDPDLIVILRYTSAGFKILEES